MKIGIVVTVNQDSGGIYQYTASILEALYRWDTDGEFIIFIWPGNSLPLDKFIGPQWKIEIMDPGILSRSEDIQPYLTGDGLDLSRPGVNARARDFFSMHRINLLIYPAPQTLSFECGIPYIMAIHDLQHRLQPEFPEVSAGQIWKSREYLFRNGVRYALGILVDSKVGKEDVLTFYGEHISSEHVYILPFLPAHRLCEDGITDDQKETVRKRYQLPERYLFYPAQFWLHKNHSRLIHAIHQLRVRYKADTPLILVGSNSGGPKEEARELVFQNSMFLAEQLGVRDLVHYLGYVPDEDMPVLYSMATALTMPTFFGPTNIPVLEAWELSCPVLTSDIRGIREQVGDVGILANPKDASSLAAAILQIWTDENLRQVLVEKGYRRLKRYTPVDFTHKLYAIVNDAHDRIEVDTLASTLNQQGENLFNKGNVEEALSAFTKAIEINPNYATAHKNVGVLYWQIGEIQKAVDHFGKALEIDPNDRDTILNWGEAFKSLKKNEDAAAIYASYLERNPHDREIARALTELETGKRVVGKKVVEDIHEYLVSAIVSTYNSERFIRGCLEDLEAQTIADRLEIIVVNSGSEQNEEAIVKEFQQKYSNIKYMKTDERETVYAAWNRGIKAATGKYITNANCDDRHRRDALEVMANILETLPEIALVYADVIITETENETFENRTPVGYFHWRNWKREDLLNKGCFMGPQPMWRKDVHDEYGYFDDSFVTSGDYEFWLRISQTRNFLRIPVRLGLYLKSPGSIEHSNREKQKEENIKIIEMYRECHSSGKIIRRIGTCLTRSPGVGTDGLGGHKLKEVNPGVLVSIVISTSGPQKYIRKCVESVKKYTPEAHEIIFVDNGAGKGTTKWLKQYMKENSNCSLVKCPKNASSAAIYNEGIKASTGEYIVLLSNDVVVSEKWLSGMLECMKRVPDAGIVGPMTNVSTGLQKVSTTDNVSINQLDKIAESFMIKNRYRRLSSKSIDGFCMLFARDLVEEIGLFDEQFGPGGYDDEDFCLRAVLEGRINLIAGDVYLYRQNKKAVVRNKKYFNEKWNKADSHSLSGKKYLALTAIEKGREAYQRGNIDDAVELHLEGIRLSPDDTRGYYALAEMLLQSKNYKDAIDVLKEMPQDEGDVRRFELIGYCKEGMDLYEEALKYADRALSINGNSAAALNLKGLLAYNQGDNSRAQSLFNQAIESDHGYGEPYTNLGAILWDNKPEDALDLFERGFILSPMVPDIVTNYHSAITALGDFERSTRVFEEAGLLYPNSKMIKYKLIDVLIKQGRNREAMHQIEEVIALFGPDEGILPAALKIRELFGPKEINKETKQKSTVSLCMIVKNEEKYLAKCLRSVKPVVDEMVVVDTGSTDGTKDIAAVFGAKVYDFEWTGDFSEARNFSLSKASGKWTFHLDADEVISPLDYDDFRKVIRQSTAKDAAFLVNTRNYTMNVNLVAWVANDGKYNMEESGTGWTPSEKVRLFRNDRRIRFAYPVHELVDPYLKKAGIAPKRCTVQVHHYGKMNQEKSFDKGEIYYQIGRKKLDEMGEDTIALRELAIQAEILGKHDEAVELWEKFIAIDPNEPKAYINIGISYCSLGKFEDVLETAKKALKLAPDMKEAHYHYALGKLHLGSAAESVSSLEKLLERVGKYPPAKFLLAAAYCCAREKDKGIKVLNELQKTSMSQSLPVRCHELAKGLISSGKSDYALSLLDAAIDSKCGNKNVLELYAGCLEMTADDDKSETKQTVFDNKIETTDNKCDTKHEIPDLDIFKQAWELRQKGQTDNAIETALKAIGQFPDDKRTYYFLAQMLIDTKQHKDAFDVLNEMPQDEQDAKTLELLGYCKEGMKQYDDAKNYADKALSLNPSSAPALNLKGILEYNQGNNSRAEDFFRQAIESDQGYGEPYTNLGAVRWEKDQHEALGLFEKAFTLSPMVSDVVANYHTAASTLGAFERAEPVFEDISSLYPKNKLIKYRLIDLLIKQEKHNQAMEQIEDAISIFGVDDGILSSALRIRDLLGPKEIDKTKDANNTVSLCMIVKNEEKHLSRCLHSAKPVVDEMIIVDTGSTDRTKDVAKAFGAKLYDFKWTDDFSEARNYSISKAEGKWIFVLDADEVISSLDHKSFENLIRESAAKPVAHVFTTRNYTTDLTQINWAANDGRYAKEASGSGWTPSFKVRLFPNESRIRFEFPVHELVENSLRKAGIKEIKCNIPIHHYGKLDRDSENSISKCEAYYEIGRKKLGEIGNNPVGLRELAIQAQTLERYEESIELWRKVIAIEPNTPAAFVSMGAAYCKLGKYEDALETAKTTLKLVPDMREGLYTYALSKLHLGRADQAITALEKLLKQTPGYPLAQFILSAAYCCEGKEKDGVEGFRQLLRSAIDPSLTYRCLNLAKGLVDAQSLEYAISILEAAIESKISNEDVNAFYHECLNMRKCTAVFQ